MAQEYGLETTGYGLHPIGPERLDDVELQRGLQVMQECDPAFVLIVGFSFGLFDGRCDDQLALATFIGRFRNVPIDVYVCAPQPMKLAGLLGEELRSTVCMPSQSTRMCWRGPSPGHCWKDRCGPSGLFPCGDAG